MNQKNCLSLDDIASYIENNIGAFHANRLKSLQNLQLNKIISRKNPYLFRAKNVLTAQDFVKLLLDAFLSSQEETIFGNFLEELSIYICGKVYGGIKSSAEGLDLEFEKDNRRYIVAIKSGPNWGNSSQITKMKQNFDKAKRVIRGASKNHKEVIAVNGCCYGRDSRPDKGEYFKYCGQKYWEFISGETDLYTHIIEPLGHKAKEKNDKFYEAYSKIINKFTHAFIDEFCNDGLIDWEAVVRYNSSEEKPKLKRKNGSSRKNTR